MHSKEPNKISRREVLTELEQVEFALRETAEYQASFEVDIAAEILPDQSEMLSSLQDKMKELHMLDHFQTAGAEVFREGDGIKIVGPKSQLNDVMAMKLSPQETVDVIFARSRFPQDYSFTTPIEDAGKFVQNFPEAMAHYVNRIAGSRFAEACMHALEFVSDPKFQLKLVDKVVSDDTTGCYPLWSLKHVRDLKLQEALIDSLIKNSTSGESAQIALDFVSDLELQRKLVTKVVGHDTTGCYPVSSLKQVRDLKLQEALIDSLIKNDTSGNYARIALDFVSEPALQARLVDAIIKGGKTTYMKIARTKIKDQGLIKLIDRALG